MAKTFPRSIPGLAVLVAFLVPASSAYSQIPSGSSARSIPTEVERSDKRVVEIISRSEDHFKKGKLNLGDNKREQARDEFDLAVDTILESGLDVRASQRLNSYYLELVERIYREEVPLQQTTPRGGLNSAIAQNTDLDAGGSDQAKKEQSPTQIGFREQKFEPSPLDELSKLVLTPEEQNVSPEDVAGLELAKNSVDFKFNTNPLIQQFINYYQGRGRSTMENGLRRSGQFMRMAKVIFKQEGVPIDLTWLAQVESSWRPTAYSYAAASGLWQFVPGTGARFGLRQTAWLDERNSFEKATRASAKYLRWLSDRYHGNWELAMAAYNTGEGNVDRAISHSGAADFWRIYPYIAQQTRNYVPNILATILISKNPEKYGFRNIKREAPMAYDVVQVPTATSLQLIAGACDTSADYIRALNPELKRDVTPRGEAFNVRVPAGKAKQFVAILKRVPGDRRESARIVSAAPGEDLQTVAQRTGLSVDQIRALNPGVSGGKLVVETSYFPKSYSRAGVNTAQAAPGVTRVKANAGDTIAKIAAAHNVSADELARLNGTSVDAELSAGQEIRMPVQASAPQQVRSHRRRRR